MEQIAVYKHPNSNIAHKCHHIIRYDNRQKKFIKDVFKFTDGPMSSIGEFFSCSLCLDCAYKIFINSQFLQHFEPLLTNPIVFSLYIVNQIICYPQIP